MLDNHLWTMEPVGREENTIQGKKYRFTLLTSRLIRMEYREDGKFEDRPTQSVWNRRFEPVAHRLVTEEEGFELFTDHMHVVYSGKPFSKNSLMVKALGAAILLALPGIMVRKEKIWEVPQERWMMSTVPVSFRMESSLRAAVLFWMTASL